MHKSVLCLSAVVLLACLTAPLHAEPLRLAHSGATGYVLIQSAAPTEAERYAASELVHFFQRATGAELSIVDEADHDGTRAIYLGWTAFAQRQGIDLDALGREEWMLRTVGSDLILAGGRPRGTLYAVYEFLETQLGVRFLDPDTERVPEQPMLTLAGPLNDRNAPAFERREIYTVVNGHGPEAWTRFQVRLKINSFANGWRELPARYGYSLKHGSPYTTHTHHRYVDDFPEAFDQEDHIALTHRGNRDPNRQPCMSHPDVRRIFKSKLREYIRRDRAALLQAGRGPDSFPRYYSLVPNDGTSGKCVCDRCLALKAKHGAYAGVVLDFTNDIAEDIAADHPEIVVLTSAYLYYRDIPEGIRPRDNVVVKLAQLPASYNTLPLRDHLRGFDHPLNAAPRQEWVDWGALSPSLSVHDYWHHHNTRTLAGNLKFYHEHGVKHFFTENLLLGSRLHNLVDVQFYVASKLLQNPAVDSEAAIAEFLTLYYGPAAPVMRQFMDYLERRQEEEPNYHGRVPASALAYRDVAFYVDTDALLAKAESLVTADSRTALTIRQERLPLDRAMLGNWHRLARKARDGGVEWPFDRQQVYERLAANYELAYAKYGGWGAARARSDAQELDYLRDMPPVPAQFEGREIVDFCGPGFGLTRARRVPRLQVDDPDAATGKAWRLEAEFSRSSSPDNLMPVVHNQPPEFGLSDAHATPRFRTTRILEPAEIPQDENYHWHHVGRAQMTRTLYFYAHHSWIFDFNLGRRVYNAALPDQKDYDVYVSLKLEGPAYVPGSERANAFSIDRLILVEVDPETDP